MHDRRLIKPTSHRAKIDPQGWWKNILEGGRVSHIGGWPAWQVGPVGPT
jgi:hypothetical protein